MKATTQARVQKCSQFGTKEGKYYGCQNIAEYADPIRKKYPVDFCAMHNHMQKTGMPVKCWRCGDR